MLLKKKLKFFKINKQNKKNILPINYKKKL
jgi:hypothetical protein